MRDNCQGAPPDPCSGGSDYLAEEVCSHRPHLEGSGLSAGILQ